MASNFTQPDLAEDLEAEDNFTYVTEGVILTIVSSFGLVGNVMSIFVLMRVAVQGSFSNLLRGKRSTNVIFSKISTR